MRTLLFSLIAIFQVHTAAAQQSLEIESPNGKNKLQFTLQDGLPFYRLTKGKDVLIEWSALGLKLKNQQSFKSFKISLAKKKRYSDVWKPLWEKTSSIKNEYHELKTVLVEEQKPAREIAILFRVYNDGFAFRYELPAQAGKDSIEIEHDLTTFLLTPGGTCWSFNGERKNLGPAQLSELPDTVQTPFLYKNPTGNFIAVLEAAIDDMAFFALAKDSKDANKLISVMPGSAVKLPARTSWRVIMTAESELQLVESDLIVNLNPPNAIKDVSWIRPGKSTWNWRGWGYKTAGGYEYKINTESQKRFIDFAAVNKIQYHLIDANWYGPEFDKSSDPTVANPEFDIKQIISYGNKNAIGIFLYLNDVGAKKYGLERVLKQFHDWGAVGIKYGFMKGGGQDKVLFTRQVITLCAKYKLMLFFHDDPVPPSGDHRTWPHVLAREFGHAQADGKHSVYPESAINQPFINMLAGPLDMNYGWFDLNEAIQRRKVGEAVPGTVAGELAKMSAIFSGFVCLPDVPEEYLAKPEMFDFIRRLPPNFDEYRVLAGKIDNYLSVARRANKNWIVASFTNRDERNIEITLSFLQKDKQYMLYIYADDTTSHFLTNKEAYKTNQRKVTAGEVVHAYLAPGGGHCMYIELID